MSTEFWIQAGRPRWHACDDPLVETIDEAVENMFEAVTEDAFIVWQHIYVPLGYKYDIGTILTQILWMVSELTSKESGECKVVWPSNTFCWDWHLRWSGESLVVTASDWRAVVGHTEELLRARPVVQIEKTEFLCEWKALLERVHEALIAGGGTIAASPGCALLGATIAKIPRYGQLYQEP